MANLFYDCEPDSGALFSANREYRYALYRIWNPDLPLVMFIGLNPSTANEDKNDPTIRRVIGFANKWGYGGVYMMNLFAVVSSDPSVLKTHPDPIGDNDKHLNDVAAMCQDVVFAWGAFKEARERCRQVIERFPNAYALKINADGSPIHPLYVRADIERVHFASHLNKQG